MVALLAQSALIFCLTNLYWVVPNSHREEIVQTVRRDHIELVVIDADCDGGRVLGSTGDCFFD